MDKIWAKFNFWPWPPVARFLQTFALKFHYNEGKIICTPPPSPCHFSLLAAKYIFSSWLFFNSSADKLGISFLNIACKWMQMSSMQSSPFQELVLLNILIHRMIINQTETSCFTPAVAEKPKQWLCLSPCWQSTKVEEFWKWLYPVTLVFHQNGWKSV